MKETVVGRGIKKGSECYKACIERLYKMAELYVKVCVQMFDLYGCVRLASPGLT